MLTSELADLLEMVDLQRGEIVPCLLGDPGIGKTQGIYEFARKHNRNVVEIIASQIMPSEVSGITMPDPETKSMQIFDHARLASLKDGDILFFDELLQAPQAVLSACLTLIQERRMMSGKMLPDIMIVAAANPLRSPTLMAESIRQRFMFIDMKWDAKAWQEYVVQKYDIRPSNSLIAAIESSWSDADKWNRLTPRTATKLLAWGKTLDEEQLPLFKKTIIQMFNNERVAKEFVRLIKPSKDEGQEDNAELFSTAIKAFCDAVWKIESHEKQMPLAEAQLTETKERLKYLQARMSWANFDVLINHMDGYRLNLSTTDFMSLMKTLCDEIDDFFGIKSGKTKETWELTMAVTY